MINNLSIIVPVLDAQDDLLLLLSRLGEQFKNYHESFFLEIVIVDDGSKVPIVIEGIDLNFTVKVIRQNNLGVSAARNSGLRHASCEFVTFLDVDDFLYLNGVLDALWLFGNERNIDYIAGRHRTLENNELVSYIPQFIGCLRRGEGAKYLFKRSIAPRAGSVVFRRSKLPSSIFDERLKKYEDLEFNFWFLSKLDGVFSENLFLDYVRSADGLSTRFTYCGNFIFEKNFCISYQQATVSVFVFREILASFRSRDMKFLRQVIYRRNFFLGVDVFFVLFFLWSKFYESN